MDWSVLVAPILSAILSAIVASRMSATQMQTKVAVLESKMDILTESVKKHNNLVERMAVAEREQRSLWHSIEELKESVERLDATIGHAPS